MIIAITTTDPRNDTTCICGNGALQADLLKKNIPRKTALYQAGMLARENLKVAAKPSNALPGCSKSSLAHNATLFIMELGQ